MSPHSLGPVAFTPMWLVMSTLTIPASLVPSLDPYPPDHTYVLRAAPVADEEPEAFELTEIKEHISSRDHGLRQVYRATLLVPETSERFDVVIKIGYQPDFHDRLKEEASIYQRLVPLEHQFTPLFWGLFTGETDEGPTAILVLEDGGEELKVAVVMQPTYFRCAPSTLYLYLG